MTSRWLLRIVLAALLPVLPAAGQDLLLKGGTLLTVTGDTIENGDILVRDGRIAVIGRDLAAPQGIRVIDVSGRFVLPGLIDSHTHIGVTDTNEMGDAVTSEVNVRDIINGEDQRLYNVLTGGVTLIHSLHGSANPIGGQSLLMKPKWGRTAEEMIVEGAPGSLKFALGENPKQAIFYPAKTRYPKSRMGVKAIIRREMIRAREYMEKWRSYRAAVDRGDRDPNLIPPRRDLRLEPLVDLLTGKTWAHVHAYRADEMLEFLELADEFQFKIGSFEHASEAFKIAGELAAAGVGLTCFMESWSYKMETAEGIATNAAFCALHGVTVALNSDSGPQMMFLFNQAGKAMRYGGLSEAEALKLVTINPARLLGVDHRLGSLEVGKDADIAVFNLHPLSAYTRCEMTIIEGEVYFDRDGYLERQEKAEREARKKEMEKQKKKKKPPRAPLPRMEAVPGGSR